MRYSFLLCLFIIPFCSIAQTEAPKGTNRITVTNNKTAEENFKLALSTLSDSGYDIENADSKLFILKTQESFTKKMKLGYYVNIIAKDSSIVITGKLRRNLTTFTDIHNGSLGFGITFDEIDNLARKFTGKIIYSKL